MVGVNFNPKGGFPVSLRRLLLTASFIIISLTLTGCWDVTEVNRRANVNAMFLDIGENEDVKMGCSFNIPGSMIPPYVGTEQLFAKRNFTLSAQGIGLLDAWKNLQSHAFRDIFFGQLRAVIISEQFAREDIHNLLDFVGRKVIIPGETFILVTKDDPEQLIDIKLQNNLLPGEYIGQFFQSPAKVPLAPPVQVWEVFSTLANQSSDIFMPMIRVSQEQYQIAGTALFSGSKMVGELDIDETLIFSLMDGVQSGYLTVPLEEDRLIAFQEIRSKTGFTPNFTEDGQLHFNIEMKMNGLLRETQPRVLQVTLEDKEQFEAWTESHIRQEATKLLSKLQTLNSDPVNFGQAVRIKHPKYWETIQWHDVFPKAMFTVNVEFNIIDTGLLR